MKAELDVHRRELAVMMRTEEIIRQQADAVHAKIEKIERQLGVAGHREKRKKLEDVSATKADLDDMKGKTLEQMSELNKEIQRNIQARQNELKPFVAALQEQRKAKAAIENKYLQAKQRYQNAVNEYEGSCMELQEEIGKMRAEIAVHQTKFHKNTHQLMTLQRAEKRARDETKAQETGAPISKTIKTYTDYFQKESRSMRKQTKDLKEQKKTLGSESDTNQKQLEAFQSLRRLLQVKAQCQKASKVQEEIDQQRAEAESSKADQILDLTKDDTPPAGKSRKPK
jgi:intraflagellar transport protein 81